MKWTSWVLLDERGKPWRYLDSTDPVVLKKLKDARYWVKTLKTKRGGKYTLARATLTVSGSRT